MSFVILITAFVGAATPLMVLGVGLVMLFSMVGAANFQQLATPAVGGGPATYWIVALILIFAVEANALMGPGRATQKPLGTVSGTIHMGLGLTAVVFIAMGVLI